MLKREILDKYGSQLEALGINLSCVTKPDLLKIINFRCRHKHPPYSHPACYKRSDNNLIEKIGILDIETSNLKANYGIVLAWCIKPLGKKRIYQDHYTDEDRENGSYDKRIVESIIDCMSKFDRVVTHFGTYFDIPFLRTRAEKYNLFFPSYGQIYHTDVWRIARRKLCLSSNRQDVVAEAILGTNIKTRIHPDKWLQVQFGNDKERKAGIDYIVDHCIKDVKQLTSNYERIRKYVKEGRTSI